MIMEVLKIVNRTMTFYISITTGSIYLKDTWSSYHRNTLTYYRTSNTIKVMESDDMTIHR